jgi:YVTN family beta-propeller protein
VRAALVLVAACSATTPPPRATATHSSSIALSPSGDRLFVVNADADSVSVIDPVARKLVAEVALGTPVLDSNGAFTPSVMPRALAVAGTTLYVTGERAGALFAIDLASLKVRSVAVGSEPIGVLVAPDGGVFVACSQDNSVVRVDPASFAVTKRVVVESEPWALAWSATGTLLVSHLVSPAITVIDPATLAVVATWSVPAIALRSNDPRLPHGTPRGFYDLASRPNSGELWMPHILLGTDTPQPTLDFERTAFPAIALARPDGTSRRTLSVDVEDIARTDGSFGDVVSGPHAIAFTADGVYALVVDTNSEDILVVDARSEVEATLLRPLPGHMPEGIVIAANDTVAYVDERNTHDIAIVRLDRSNGGIALTVDGVIPRLTADPMPADLRTGQHLFYSANSDEHPITRNHWIACATCHIEGRSDAVTWLFAQGPRDTPSNAGGTRGTGFLFRTADRTRVQDYWQTIDIEQGGRFDQVAQRDLLDPIAAYVDRGIPAPIPPTTNPALVARGRALFEDPTVGCATCHSGPRFTDSGAGNPTLDLAGPVLLHDVGTCGASDVAHPDRDGHDRQACMFDTPSLTGIASSPPYLHDGRAATLLGVLEQTRGKMGHVEALAPDDLNALVEYMRSL